MLQFSLSTQFTCYPREIVRCITNWSIIIARVNIPVLHQHWPLPKLRQMFPLHFGSPLWSRIDDDDDDDDDDQWYDVDVVVIVLRFPRPVFEMFTVSGRRCRWWSNFPILAKCSINCSNCLSHTHARTFTTTHSQSLCAHRRVCLAFLRIC